MAKDDEETQQHLTNRLLTRIVKTVNDFEKMTNCDGTVIVMALSAAVLGEMQAADKQAPDHAKELKGALRKVLGPYLKDPH